MIYLGIIISVFLQSTLSTIPIIIPILVYYFIFSKKMNAFGMALVSGIFIDIFLLNPIGATSLFLTIILFIISLYSKKFEIQTPIFLVLITFISTLIYSFLFSPDSSFQKAIFNIALALLILNIIKFWKKKNIHFTSLVK